MPEENNQPFDQQQAIVDYTRIMEAGPVGGENEQTLQNLLKQAYEHNMYFDFDRANNTYILVGPASKMTEAERVAMIRHVQEVGKKIGEICDEVKVLSQVYPGLVSLLAYRQARAQLLSSWVLLTEEVPDYITRAREYVRLAQRRVENKLPD